MDLESAIYFLKRGHAIYRESCPERGYLCGTEDKPYGSFYLTLWDVLAEDWKVDEEKGVIEPPCSFDEAEKNVELRAQEK